jgi:hypothetical protein
MNIPSLFEWCAKAIVDHRERRNDGDDVWLLLCHPLKTFCPSYVHPPKLGEGKCFARYAHTKLSK